MNVEMVANAKGRTVPSKIGDSVFFPYEGPYGKEPRVKREIGRIARHRKPGDSKLLSSIDDAIKWSGLEDGMTISFHHHLRNGDSIVNLVLDRIMRRNIKGLRLFPSALFPVHEPVVDRLKDGTLASIEGSMNGPVGRYVSLGNMEGTAILRSHSGRARAIAQGDVRIDVAFIAASCSDHLGNCNGMRGPSAFGPMGFAHADALFADKSILITDNIVDFPCNPISIPGTNIDKIVKIDSIGDPGGILSGSLMITNRPDHLRIVDLTMKTMDAMGLLKDGFAFQAGAGGISLALTKYISDLFREKGMIASYANGGTTRYLVEMLHNGNLKNLLTGQCFDLESIRSLLEDDAHQEICVDQYSNIHGGATSTEVEQAAFLGATEVDVDFNVNVNTHSDGYLLHGIGGHQDVAYGSQLTFITIPLARKGNPIIRDEVITITTPGELIDVVVTEKGLTVNTEKTRPRFRERNQDIEKACIKAGLPVHSMDELRKMAQKDGPDETFPDLGDRVVALIEYIDGSVLDKVMNVIEM
ncbi:MAG: citrate lyase subunit alpha [Thermoplasmatota archaeon]